MRRTSESGHFRGALDRVRRSRKRSSVMKRIIFALALTCLGVSTIVASAQDKYPAKPVKVIVPYAPGGATDITSRLFGEQLRQSLGQQFVVESKPGAFGILAIE